MTHMLLPALRLWACGVLMVASTTPFAGQPNIALFYGPNPPWDELAAFDVVVVEPEHVHDPKAHATERTALFAYVSVGEASHDRAYLKDIPADWRMGQNSDWGSVLLDQSQPGWPDFFSEHVIQPLWQAGYRGFFLDTLDSFRKFAKTDADRARQEAGLVAVIRELKKRYPEARLIFNRGFEVLPQLHREVFAVAAESLFQGWDPARQVYRTVPAADRDWLLAQLRGVHDDFGLPILSIDYVPPGKRDLARETAAKIRDLGFIPWVTNATLDMLGVGNIEVMPRKVLMIHNSANTDYDLENTDVLLYATTPLNYLGYVAEYVDARAELPAYPLTGRYAGIVVWLENPPRKEGGALAAWLRGQIDAGVPFVLLGDADFLLARSDPRQLGLDYSEATPVRTPLHIMHRDSVIGFETQPDLDRQEFFPLQVMNGQPLLTVANDREEKQDAVALTSWGGYALNPHVLIDMPSTQHGKGENQRWVINPIEFLQRALRLPDMPVPDVTTESGRRLLMVHMDGDGFANKGEFPGFPYGAQILYDRVLRNWQLPATISVIQGEVASNGKYPELSPDLEKIARKIFALPHVEIASHSFSHPFAWQQAALHPMEPGPAVDGYRLDIPGYSFDLQKEIPGSIAYIESRLAPPGKKVKVFLWTGDCNVGADALALADRSGVVGMNGGDTTITRSAPTLALVAPLGIPKSGYFQVYAPNQNENVYTNDWLGPFFGYERVIETFDLTDTPRRLKPIDVYFHTYSASKPASLRALEKVLKWAQQQETMPIYVSEYVRKVLDFNRAVVARTPDGWLVRDAGDLRELRAPLGLGKPALAKSRMLAGFSRYDNSQYLHLAGSEAEIRFQKSPERSPFLVSANARIEHLTRADTANGRDLGMTLHGHVPLQFVLSLDARCAVNADGRTIRASRMNGDGRHFSMRSHDIDRLQIHCPQ